MNRFVSVTLLSMTACGQLGDRAATGECPTGEVCSDGTPNGLRFDGAGLVGTFSTGPAATAVGGVQNITLSYADTGGEFVALDLPYTVDDGGGAAVAVEAIAGPTVTVSGVGNGANALRVLDKSDGTLLDKLTVDAGTIGRIGLVDEVLQSSVPQDGSPVAFWVGTRDVGVALYAATTDVRLADTGMTLELAGATRRNWDLLEITSATPATRTIEVTAGDQPIQGVDVVFVDRADAIEIQPDQRPLPAGGSGLVCFTARSGASWISAAPWTFATDNGTIPSDGLAWESNCVQIDQPQLGAAHVTATIGSTSLTATIQVTPGGNAKRATSRTLVPTYGERASRFTR